MIPRFRCPNPLPAGGEFELPAEVAHHAEKVLRLRSGDSLVLFDGDGREVSARLLAGGRGARVELLEWTEPARESPLQIVLVQALASGDKMDWVIQKAVELGVGAIQPLIAERCVLRLSGERAERRLRHWRQVVVSACEQSGRNRVPVVESPVELPLYLQHVACERCLALAPGAAGRLAELPAPPGELRLLVGPEGGWSERELSIIDAAGVRRIGLGPRILRTETAGLAALAAMQALWGDV